MVSLRVYLGYVWVMTPEKWYGLLVMGELWVIAMKSLHTDLENGKSYGLSRSMGFTPYALWIVDTINFTVKFD
jgi:hypothetical protein